MTTTATLDDWEPFHDWYLDTVKVGPNKEPRTLSLGLYLGDRRITLIFDGVTCFHLAQLGLLNIVNGLRTIEAKDEDYGRVIAQLAKGERLSDRRGAKIGYLYSTLGAELAIEFDSWRVVSEAAG
ncbi:hypothetical protein SB397_26035 [Burkholderia multivorans]|uniref:hypothetical protein n=1 Tax=Burkholderia multivorans TaxID=87883 RepID=UPI000A8D3D7B|nr:hypothetical protein [Burkholderia multivorans]MEB2489039.1 hypothetical protein [Burkholderia multivorans]MEB2568224.1 hypothetical protein [Burkholderia multivorans]